MIRVDQERHQRTGQAGCRFDHVGHVAGVGALVVVRQIDTGCLCVAGQVVVGAVGDTFQLTPPRAAGEAELVLDIGGAGAVVRQLLQRVLVEPQILRSDTQVGVPLQPGLDPVLVPLRRGGRLDEELHLHLLELTGPEDEIARGDLVAEALADLADAERRLLACGGHHVGEVDEDALRGFGPQVVQPPLLGLDGGRGRS